MTTFILAVCGVPFERSPEDRGWHIKRYAYMGDLNEHEKIKDNRDALKYLRALMPSDNQDSSWIVNVEPPADVVRFFDVIVRVGGQDEGEMWRHGCDYHKYNGCPSEAIDDGMIIYHAIKKHGIRKTTDIEKAARLKAKQEAKAKAEFEARRVKFEDGNRYYANRQDSLGYIVREYITFDEQSMRRDVRMFENGDEYIARKGLYYRATNKG